jgi:hypothetical protein
MRTETNHLSRFGGSKERVFRGVISQLHVLPPPCILSTTSERSKRKPWEAFAALPQCFSLCLNFEVGAQGEHLDGTRYPTGLKRNTDVLPGWQNTCHGHVSGAVVADKCGVETQVNL